MKSRTLQLAAAVLLAAASALGQEGGRQAAPPEPSRYESRQIDSYGNIRHCDWSARLDNFAIELQNDPSARGYVVGYDAPGRHPYAPRELRVARYYLSESRGIDPARLVLVEGGTREDLKEGRTELWLVPAGAEPPAAPAAFDKYAAGFSGKFDTYSTDPNVYQEVYEVGTPYSFISRTEFAAKLRQQPESVGYILIRTPKGGAPGGWRRLARRDEQALKELGVGASRLRSLDGGPAEGREAEIEFWLLPPWAPPPAVPDKAAETFNAAARLHTFDAETPETKEDTRRWMLDNLAEFLRQHPKASALLVAREPPPEQIEGADAGAAPETAAGSSPAASAAADSSNAADPSGEAASTEEGAGEEEPAVSMKELAERWKAQLVGKYGVAPGRVVVSEGRPVRWPAGRLNLWVIPENGKWPDPSAPDEDEAEREEFYGVFVKADAQPAAKPAR